MHRIRETGIVTLEGKTFEVELQPHHEEQTYNICEKDCPLGWQIATYQLLQEMRNNLETRAKFNLSGICEFVQNPDNMSKTNGYVSRFHASPLGAGLDCLCDASSSAAVGLKVRYFREIFQA